MKNKIPVCPYCHGNLHCQYLDNCLTDAFCFNCKADIKLGLIQYIDDPYKAISVKQP